MNRKTDRYIGVTGFMSRAEVESVYARTPIWKTGIVLMCGVLVSSKTVRGVTNRYPGRYPRMEAVRGIFIDDDEDARVTNIVHYATDTDSSLFEQLEMVAEIGGPDMHGVQINYPWPAPIEIKKYAKKHPEHRVILQIGPATMREGEPRMIAQCVLSYGRSITDVLIDPSGGAGQPMSLSNAIPVLECLEALRCGVGVAGGLSAVNVESVLATLAPFGVSIDAEGRLRDENDKLDLEKTIAYVNAAVAAIV